MSGKELVPPNPDTVAATIKILEPLVEQVPLSEKLLARPPFRYLLDLIHEIYSNTGFGNGLYTEEEFNSANYTNKEAKVGFLNKILALVNLEAPSNNIRLNPLKVVAGLDSETTNLFLQILGRVASAKSNTSVSVQRILGTDSKQSLPKPEPTTTVTASTQQRPPTSQGRPETASRPRSAVAGRVRTAQPVAQPEIPQQPIIDPFSNEAPTVNEALRERHRELEPIPLQKPIERVARPGSAFGEKRKSTQSGDYQNFSSQDLRKSLAEQRGAEGMQPIPKMESLSLVPDQLNKESDEFEVLIPEALEEQGFLNWLQKANAGNSSLEQKAIDKERAISLKEIADLKATIEQLCAVANPIGSTLEYIQADFEAMDSELNYWKKENAKLDKKLKQDSKSIKQLTSPQNEPIAKIESSIKVEIGAILALKSQISENDKKIQKLCRSIIETPNLDLAILGDQSKVNDIQ